MILDIDENLEIWLKRVLYEKSIVWKFSSPGHTGVFNEFFRFSGFFGKTNQSDPKKRERY